MVRRRRSPREQLYELEPFDDILRDSDPSELNTDTHSATQLFEKSADSQDLEEELELYEIEQDHLNRDNAIDFVDDEEFYNDLKSEVTGDEDPDQ